MMSNQKKSPVTTAVVTARPSAKTLRNRRRRQRDRSANAEFSQPLVNFPRSGNSTNRRADAVITQDEFITDISGSTSFSATGYNVNIGDSVLFPWGSKNAAQYEKYAFDYLEFYFKPTVSAFATNGQQGKVIFMFDYDAADATPISKRYMEDSDPHVDAMPYQSMSLKVDTRRANSSPDGKFIRVGGIPGGTDIKTYDVGKLFVGTSGNFTNTPIGELHVRYRVRLLNPILTSNLLAPPPCYCVTYLQVNPSSLTTGAHILSAWAPLINGLQIPSSQLVSGNLELPAGNYMLFFQGQVQSDSTTTHSLASASLTVFQDGVTAAGTSASGKALIPTSNGISIWPLNTTQFVQTDGTSIFTFVVSATFLDATSFKAQLDLIIYLI